MKNLINSVALALCMAMVATPSIAGTASPNALNNKELVQRLFSKAYNAHDLDHLDQFFTTTFVHRDARGDQSLAAVKNSFAPVFGAFSDWHATIDQILVDGDRVMVFVTWSGTHDGNLRGYPATGKRVQVRSADMYRIESGKIAEHWDVASPLDLMQQIGLLEYKFAKP